MRWCWLFLIGCTPTAQQSPWAPPIQTLELTQLGEATAQRMWGLQVEGAQPGETLELYVANGGLGAGPCPPNLGGHCLGMLPGSLGVRPLTTLTADANGSATWQVSFPTAVADGLYQVQAFAPDGTDANASTPVEIEVRSDCRADDAEPNDDLASAAPYVPGMVACRDGDWISTTVPADAYVDVRVTHALRDGDVDVELWSTAGYPLDTSKTARAEEQLLWFNGTGADADVAVWVYTFDDPQGNGVGYSVEFETVAVGVCNDDAAEDDDDAASAQAATTGLFSGRVCLGDNDWYAVDVPAGERVTASVDTGSSARLSARLLTMADGEVAPPGSTVVYNAAVDTEVFIEVELTNDTVLQQGADYELDIVVEVPGFCIDDAAEEDDIAADATAIQVGVDYPRVGCDLDADWFSIEVPAGQTAILDLRGSASAENLVLMSVFDDQLQRIARQRRSYSYTATTTTTIFAEVTVIRDLAEDGANYSFSADLSTLASCPVDPFEPNELASDAVRITPSFTQGLGICNGDNDWFEFRATAGDAIDVQVLFSNADGDVDAFLYDPSGGRVAAGETVSDNETLNHTASTTGIYTVWVILFGEGGGPTADGVTYDLSLELQ